MNDQATRALRAAQADLRAKSFTDSATTDALGVIHGALGGHYKEDGSLAARLIGRAKFLRQRGEVKSADLMEQAARELSA